MAGFLQTLQRRVAGRVLVYSNLGTAMVRGTASRRGVDVGMEWIILTAGLVGSQSLTKAAGVLERWTMDLESSMNFGVFRCRSLFVGSVSCTFA